MGLTTAKTSAWLARAHRRFALGALAAWATLLLCSSAGARLSLPHRLADVRFVAAPAPLRAQCVATANAVGYPVPCPSRVPLGLAAFGGRQGCELDIIGPGRQCPNTVLSWRGWVVGSSIAQGEHLVIVASPGLLSDVSKLVNGPAWYRGARVTSLASVRLGGRRVREIYVPPETNEGSAFASHVVLVWDEGGHTYGVGFHDLHGIAPTLALDETLARSIVMVSPHR